MSCFPPAMRPQPLLTMHFGRQPSRLLHPARFLSPSRPRSSPPALELASAPINTPARRKRMLRTTFHDVPLQVLFLALSAYLSENTNQRSCMAHACLCRSLVIRHHEQPQPGGSCSKSITPGHPPPRALRPPSVRVHSRDATFKLAGAVE